MALETGTYISDLVATNPTASDGKNQGDDHIRLLKSTVKATFPNVSGAVLPTHTELNYVDGVTSAIQTQIDAKAPLASPSLTGAPTAPTPGTGDNSTKIATTAFVVATSLTSSLPGQTGKNRYLLSTDGTTGDWYNTIDTSVVTPVSGTAFATTTGTQTLTNKTLTVPVIVDSSDTTKKANFVLSGVTAGQNRTITVKDNDIILDTPGWVKLSSVTASNSATVDLETTIDSTYKTYIVVFESVKLSTTNLSLLCRLKIAGSYHSGASDYVWAYYVATTTYAGNLNTTGDTSILLSSNIDGSDSTKLISGNLSLSDPANTGIKKRVKWEMMYKLNNTGNLGCAYGNGCDLSSNGAVTGIRFVASSGNIVSGNFTLFGIRG